ncbi:hypothetical protein G6F22_020446 [Rhizopus arrhizus]|nr:hypothetical protein G6F22_020446 [Rhizopus arrhizus]
MGEVKYRMTPLVVPMVHRSMTLPQKARVVDFAVRFDVGGRRELLDPVQRDALAVVAEALVLSASDHVSARRDNDSGVTSPHRVAHDRVARVRRPDGGSRRIRKKREKLVTVALPVCSINIR